MTQTEIAAEILRAERDAERMSAKLDRSLQRLETAQQDAQHTRQAFMAVSRRLRELNDSYQRGMYE